jgi:sec-independent protein translocase protein TatA
MSYKNFFPFKKGIKRPSMPCSESLFTSEYELYISSTLPNAIAFDFIRMDGVSLSKACHFGKDVIEETIISDYNTINNSKRRQIMVGELFSPMHLLVVLVIALIVFGPGKLPELGSSLGKAIKEFKKVMNDPEKIIKK